MLPGPGRRPVLPGGATLAEALLWPVVRRLARSRTTETAVVTLPDGRTAVRKLWTWPRRRDVLKGAFRTTIAARSPAARECAAAEAIQSLPVGPCGSGEAPDPLREAFAPAPLGAAEERVGGALVRCVAVFAFVPDATDLAAWLVEPARTESEGVVRGVLADLAGRLRGFHDTGHHDREMHPRNVLVAPREEPPGETSAGSSGDPGRTLRTWKVDLPKCRVPRPGRTPRPVGIDARADDLGALDVGLVRLAPAFRDGFLAAYAGGTPDAALLRAVERARARHERKEAPRLPSPGHLARRV